MDAHTYDVDGRNPTVHIIKIVQGSKQAGKTGNAGKAGRQQDERRNGSRSFNWHPDPLNRMTYDL